MKLFLRFLLILLILGTALFFGKNVLIKAVTEKAVKSITGLPLTMEKLNVSFSGSLIDIDGLKLMNPDAFTGDPFMIDLPKIFVDFELLPLLQGKVALTKAQMHLRELVVVKNPEGKLNIDALKSMSSGAPEKEAPEPEEKSPPPDLRVDELHLRIDRVVYKDYSKGDVKEKVYNININETILNIQKPSDLVNAIMFKALSKTTIASLANIDLDMISSTLSGSLKMGTEAATQVIKGTTDIIEGTGRQTVDTTTETIKGAADNLKDIIKNPFGEK